MNDYLNYIVEANIGLLLFLLAYRLLLKGETNFRLLRMALLTGILASLFFPLIDVGSTQGSSAISIGRMVPSYWLPEVVIGGDRSPEFHEAPLNFWKYTTVIYSSGLIVFLLMLIVEIRHLLTIIHGAKTYSVRKLRIAESTEDRPTFSFFNFIFIGKADQLSSIEKEHIIRHESVHAAQWHSLDILLINFLQIFFWFNPIINTYKKIFIQLHEFEADARAVENSDLDKYCRLLAKVALKSAGFTLANHFNDSLTVKRIEMMRTIKNKIQPWRMAVIAFFIPASFFVISCHDQIGNEISESTITQTSEYPAAVKADMDAYLLKHPNAKLTYIEGLEDEINKVTNSQKASLMIINTYDLSEDGSNKKGVLFDNLTHHAEALKADGVFVIVEEVASFEGGLPGLLEHLRANMLYPEASRKAGVGGTVHVEFVVNEQGTLSDVKVIKGVNAELDAEALRAVKTLPPWKPGRQNGVAVKMRYVLPISFNPDFPNKQEETISHITYTMEVKAQKTKADGRTIVEGTVLSKETHKPLAGANILVAGTSTGTVANADGKFRIEVPAEEGQLVVSYVGYDFEKVDL